MEWIIFLGEIGGVTYFINMEGFVLFVYLVLEEVVEKICVIKVSVIWLSFFF